MSKSKEKFTVSVKSFKALNFARVLTHAQAASLFATDKAKAKRAVSAVWPAALEALELSDYRIDVRYGYLEADNRIPVWRENNGTGVIRISVPSLKKEAARRAKRIHTESRTLYPTVVKEEIVFQLYMFSYITNYSGGLVSGLWDMLEGRARQYAHGFVLNHEQEALMAALGADVDGDKRRGTRGRL